MVRKWLGAEGKHDGEGSCGSIENGDRFDDLAEEKEEGRGKAGTGEETKLLDDDGAAGVVGEGPGERPLGAVVKASGSLEGLGGVLELTCSYTIEDLSGEDVVFDVDGGDAGAGDDAVLDVAEAGGAVKHGGVGRDCAGDTCLVNGGCWERGELDVQEDAEVHE